MASLDHPTKMSSSLIAASTVTGTTVYDLAGEKIGSIYDVMLNKSSGKAEYAIMNFGGLFGIGEHYHPLPWNVLKYDESKGGYVVNIDRNKLDDAPNYAMSDKDTWRDDTWGKRVNDYYGMPLI